MSFVHPDVIQFTSDTIVANNGYHIQQNHTGEKNTGKLEKVTYSKII
jgi:hypothetical protein